MLGFLSQIVVDIGEGTTELFNLAIANYFFGFALLIVCVQIFAVWKIEKKQKRIPILWTTNILIAVSMVAGILMEFLDRM